MLYKDMAAKKTMKSKKVVDKFDACIIGGAGHIGLPLGVALAVKGLKTVLLDINKPMLDQIERGIFPFREEGGEAALRVALKRGNLSTSSSPESITASKNIVMVIGTPIDEYLNPNFHGIFLALDTYLQYFQDGQTLILRSTVFPGTTERIGHYFASKGKKIHVAFCPERIVEGRALTELQTLPQLISALDDEALASAKSLFGKLTTHKLVEVKPMEAELAKLFSNAWRYITFAIGNQFFMTAADHGLDYHNIYKAMVTDYERNKDLPRPGFAAGPCLLKDTMQLAAFNNNNFFLGHAAMLVNEGLPNYIIQQLAKTVPDLHNKTIGILGMAFKAESDDPRDSLSYKLKKIAATKCKEVLCHDFYVKDPSFLPLKKVVAEADILILGAPHKGYAEINASDYQNRIVFSTSGAGSGPEIKLARENFGGGIGDNQRKVFVDIWNFWGDKR